MSVGFVAFHYPAAAHFDDFVDRVGRVAKFLGTTRGCLSVDYWVTDDDAAVVSAAHWETEDDYTAAFTLDGAPDIDIAFDEREVRPREIYKLYSR
ncbi:antibiotic biosynthesis monooxygenase [Nocardia wallacei]|uniref:antibiotic biosynthesis monooxygenase n=1 Tax=Nocardia wallacei TaxID=480035 RepID=UPI0024553279|nr:antibiotic biosynthesis monooxygenase [Nocardia wallacei]